MPIEFWEMKKEGDLRINQNYCIEIKGWKSILRMLRQWETTTTTKICWKWQARLRRVGQGHRGRELAEDRVSQRSWTNSRRNTEDDIQTMYKCLLKTIWIHFSSLFFDPFLARPVVFFAALFGTHHFEPPLGRCKTGASRASFVDRSRYVGRLRLAQDIDTDVQLEPQVVRGGSLQRAARIQCTTFFGETWNLSAARFRGPCCAKSSQRRRRMPDKWTFSRLE